MKISNYTIGSVRDFESLNKFDTVQIVLSRRIFPAQRNYPAALSESKGMHAKVILHYDYLYIITRYGLLKEHIQRAVRNEVRNIMIYAKSDPRVIGLVMHTDFPIKQEVWKKGIAVRDAYPDSIYDLDVIEKYHETKDWDTMMCESIEKFYQDLGGENYQGMKVYLENTTKVMDVDNPVGQLNWIIEQVIKHSNMFGLCIDTEHLYAVSGQGIPEVQSILTSLTETNMSLMCHLNTIPVEVKARSKKDRHSETTLDECSKYTRDDYISMINTLNQLNIPWVREINGDTVERELKQMETWSE